MVDQEPQNKTNTREKSVSGKFKHPKLLCAGSLLHRIGMQSGFQEPGQKLSGLKNGQNAQWYRGPKNIYSSIDKKLRPLMARVRQFYLRVTLICCKFSDPSPYTLPSKGGLPVRLCQSTSYFLEIAVTWQNMVRIKSPLAKCRVEIGLAGHPQEQPRAQGSSSEKVRSVQVTNNVHAVATYYFVSSQYHGAATAGLWLVEAAHCLCAVDSVVSK